MAIMNNNNRWLKAGALLPVLILAGCAASLPSRDAGSSPAALAQQADDAYDSGNLAKSERLYTRLTKMSPQTAIFWYRLGNIQARSGEPYKAISSYSAALHRKPHMAEAWYNMGLVQLRLAAITFDSMKNNTKPDDPLYKQGQDYLEGIMQLMGSASADR